ncbi:MAG: Rrf2 family transcriptional regulator [Burkholderiales bacterium]|jgi:Rrf2 family protein|nr:Rrf2 family transcriptional regulator [Burkholderiales bacterium]
MKLSAKVRYALAATIRMVQIHAAEKSVTVARLVEDLAISKIYLEQIFSLLKRGRIVTSIKGARGGYLLARPAQQISVYEIIAAVDASLFSRTPKTVDNNAPDIEATMHTVIFDKLDKTIITTLSDITLATLAAETEKHRGKDNYMYYL